MFNLFFAVMLFLMSGWLGYALVTGNFLVAFISFATILVLIAMVMADDDDWD